MKNVVAYVDGSCLMPSHVGGWGAILIYGNVMKELSGSETNTTNNRMELTAVIKALESLLEPCSVTIYCDSSYVVDSVSLGWIRKWKNDLFVHTANADLWKRLLDLVERHDVRLVKVKAHSGNEYNDMVDQLARQATKTRLD